MKKILFILALIISAGAAFASGDYSNTTFSAGISFPYMKHDYKISGEDSITLFGTGLKLNYRHQNEGFSYGLFLDSDIYIPTYKTVNLSGTETVTKNAFNYDYFFGIDVLAGVYKVLYRSGEVLVPAGIGIHLDGYTSKLSEDSASVTERICTMGLGAWANYEVNVSEKFGVFAGIKVVYDFYYRMTNNGSSDDSTSGNCKAWAVTPAAGVAFHF